MIKRDMTTSLNLFSDIDQIFLNPHILSDEYIPNHLIGRDKEIREAVELFTDPIQNGSEGINAVFFGPSGSGKSVVINLVIREVRNECKRREINNFSIIYLKVRGLSNSFVLYKLILNLNPDTKIPERGLDEYEYKKELYRLLNAQRKSLVAVFDEIDQLSNDNIIYDLSRAGADRDVLEPQFINIIGLTNDLYYMDRMASKTLSSFRPRQIPFNAYIPGDLIAILEDRKAAFKPHVLDDGVIPLCAAVSAKDNGDARKALWLLSNAGKIARRENSVRVTEEHVDKAREYFDTDIIGVVLQKLPFNVRTLLYVICYECTHGNRTSSIKVWNRYQEYCSRETITPVSRSRVSQIITELRDLGFLRTRESPGRRGGIFREIEFIQQVDKVIESLNSNDHVLK